MYRKTKNYHHPFYKSYFFQIHLKNNQHIYYNKYLNSSCRVYFGYETSSVVVVSENCDRCLHFPFCLLNKKSLVGLSESFCNPWHILLLWLLSSNYFIGYPDYLLTVWKFKKKMNVILLACHFARRDYVLMGCNRKPCSLQHLRVVVDIWLMYKLESKLHRFVRTEALVEVSSLSCWDKQCSSAMDTCDSEFSSQRLLLT